MAQSFLTVGGLVLGLNLGMGWAFGEAPPTTPPMPRNMAESDRSGSGQHPLAHPTTNDPQAELRQLRAELEKLKRERSGIPAPTANSPAGPGAATQSVDESAELAAERARLKAKLFELMERIPARRSPPPPVAEPSHDTNPDSVRPLDRVRYLQNLIKSGQYATALRAFQVMDPTSFTGKQGAMLRYLKASAHRRAGDLETAKQIYGELAQSREDDFLAECAAWQLQAIKAKEELLGRLDTSSTSRPKR